MEDKGAKFVDIPLAGEPARESSNSGRQSPSMAEEIPYMLYTGLRVRNLRRSLKFYRALGLRPIMRGKMMMEQGGTWIWLRGPESPQVLELNYYPPGNRFYEEYHTGTEMDHVGFSVRDVGPILERLEKVGVGPPVAEFDQGNIRLTFIVDPDGIWIEFLSYNEKGRRRRRGRPVVRDDRGRERGGLAPTHARAGLRTANRDQSRAQSLRGKTGEG